MSQFSIATSDVQFSSEQQSHNGRNFTIDKMVIIGSNEQLHLVNIPHSKRTITYQDYQEAAYHLQRIPNGIDDLPDIIVSCYNPDHEIDSIIFGKFLNTHRRLRGIPFILIELNQISSQKKHREQIPGVDDIVTKDIPVEDLLKKIMLLTKFKSIRQHQFKKNESQEAQVYSNRQTLYKIDAFFKRLLDILIASVALSILSPLMLLIAAIIKIDSKGPVFYNSFRAGSNYRIFKFIKFRTMIAEADHKLANLKNRNQYATDDKTAPVFFKISDDPRITHFGKFLRNTSLDELPQLFNVLKGDMSLVGNRPLPLYEAKTLTTDRHAERFNAPAGITGLWQISKRGQKEMSAEERIALDIDYARHNSFVQDLQIMLRTPKALIQKDNV